MKLITYLHHGQQRVGVLTAKENAVMPLPYTDMNTLIETASVPEVLSAAKAVEGLGTSTSLSDVTLCAPIPRPRQDVLCLGINYRDHATEAAQYNADAFAKERPIPIYFSKRVNEAVGPDGTIDSHPGLVQRLDYEAELAVILGRTARNIRPEDAAKYIFGYTVLNDVSARLLQTTHKQWYFGKSLDTFTPIGPCIVTADEIEFPPALTVRSYVNGELRQDSNTSLLITGIADILAEVTSGMTLLPGTIIATGTPAGVGMGFNPPKFLQPGDVVTCEIEGIGALRNPVR